MNIYGFHKLPTKNGLDEFINSNFRRDAPENARKMHRNVNAKDTEGELGDSELLKRQIDDMSRKIKIFKKFNEHLIESNKDMLKKLDLRKVDNTLRTRKMMYTIMTRVQQRPEEFVENARKFFIEEKIVGENAPFPRCIWESQEFSFTNALSQKFSNPADIHHNFLDKWMHVYFKDFGCKINPNTEEEDKAWKAQISIPFLMRYYNKIMSERIPGMQSEENRLWLALTNKASDFENNSKMLDDFSAIFHMG